jgi:phosphate:Na+ symporter
MTGELDKFALFTGLFGGLALFLFGMDLMTAALKRVAGDWLKDLLGKVTGNRFMGAGLGAVVTGLVNSSSVTTVIVVGFISAGLMSMAQSVSVIMGANIGSTVTAQILAFNVTRFALPTITLGFLISFLSKRKDRQDYGRMLLGLGLVFYADPGHASRRYR